MLAAHVRRHNQVELGPRHCQRLFRHMGCRLRKPRPVIAKADPAAQAALKKLRRLAADPGVDLWSSDECHFHQHGTRCRMWISPEDKDPVVLHAPTRKSVACFGAVGLRTGKLVTAFEPVFNADSFHRFLTQLLRHRPRGKRVVLVLDNARYHHARALKPWLRRHRKRLTLRFLPPYSLDLNPIERVWKLTRRLATHNRHFPTLDDTRNAVQERFALWAHPNRQLVKLCAII